MFLHVTAVEYLGDYKLKLQFNNGAEGVVDLESELYGEVFEPLRDKHLFRKAYLTSRTIEWPNGADFAPEFLFEIAELTVTPTQESVQMQPEVALLEAGYAQNREKFVTLGGVARKEIATVMAQSAFDERGEFTVEEDNQKSNKENQDEENTRQNATC
jgi:hypothetical protein